MMIQLLIWTAVVPGLLALLILGLGRRAWRGQTGPGGAWAAALAPGLAYALGNLGLSGWELSAGPETRLLWIALGGSALGLVDARRELPAAARWGLRLAGSLVASWLLVQPLAGPQQWSGAQLLLRLAPLTAGALLVWGALAAAAERERGPGLTLALALLAGGGSGVVVLAGLATVGQLSGAVAAALGGIFLVTLRAPAEGLLRGAAAPLSLLLTGHWAAGLLYGEMPAVSYGLLVAAPLLLLALRAPAARRLTGRGVALALMAAVALPLGGAAALSALRYFGDAPASAAGADPATPGGTRAGDQDDDYGYE